MPQTKRQPDGPKVSLLNDSLTRRSQEGQLHFIHSNKCHDFKWSRTLWANAAVRIMYTTLGLFCVYLTVAYFVSYEDGLRGVDIFYLYSALISTVGLGDLSPQGRLHRAMSIVLIPFGLILCSMAVSVVQARAKSVHVVVASDQVKSTESGVDVFFSKLSKRRAALQGTLAYSLVVIVLKYCVVVLIGAVFFLLHKREIRLQKDNGVDMTFIDAWFFATVVSTTTGYGHMIAPQTVAAKSWMIFYFIFSTAVVGSLIGNLSDLYLSYQEKQIEDTIIDSTTWVHKADLHKRGVLTEAAYVLFKLQQLQKVDDDTINRLAHRFDEIDVFENGLLDIGVEVPSGHQVKLMQEAYASPGNSKDLVALWQEMKTQISVESGKAAEEAVAAAVHGLKRLTGPPPLRVSNCHDFAWSRSLWKVAVKKTLVLFVCLVLLWCVLGYYALASEFNEDAVVTWYFLSATLSTTGFGDFAPTRQGTRLCACVVIPFGLVIIGLGVSLGFAVKRTQVVKPREDPVLAAKRQQQFLALTTALKAKGAAGDDAMIDEDEDGRLSKEELESAHKVLGMSREEAGELFEALDVDKKGFLAYEPLAVPWQETLLGRLAVLLVQLYATILVGAVFVKLYPPEHDALGLSWVDALYYGTVTATSVGFGDINVLSSGGRTFMTVYMLVATIFVAINLAEFINLYVNDYVGEGIIDQLIDSTTWVHKADVLQTGTLTESDYVLFKLQQMQKVDVSTLDRLVSKFANLESKRKAGVLAVGVDIPDAQQVQKMKDHLEREGLKDTTTLVECWAELGPELVGEKMATTRTRGRSVLLEELVLDESVTTTTSDQQDLPTGATRASKSPTGAKSPLQSTPPRHGESKGKKRQPASRPPSSSTSRVSSNSSSAQRSKQVEAV